VKEYLFTNLLHFDLHPLTRQIELEVGEMVSELFKGDKEVCSLTTSGGTESNEMAIFAYA